MKRILFSLFLLHHLMGSAQDQADRAGVEAAMQDYIGGFYEGDSGKISRSINKEVIKYGYYKDKQSGIYAGEPMSYQQMIEYCEAVKKRQSFPPATAPRKVEIFDVQDQTASGKVTAWWGTDYILLEKIQQKWMIRMVLWQGPLVKAKS